MALRIKVDEDLPNAITEMLRERSYDAVRVVEQGMGGWSDAKVCVAVANPRNLRVRRK
jgi:hypothetical protein